MRVQERPLVTVPRREPAPTVAQPVGVDALRPAAHGWAGHRGRMSAGSDKTVLSVRVGVLLAVTWLTGGLVRGR